MAERSSLITVSGHHLSFEDAPGVALVNPVLPAEGWWDRVLACARQFVPPGKAAKAMGRIKRAAQSGAKMPFSDALAVERELEQQLLESAGARARARLACQEKRPPQFAGR